MAKLPLPTDLLDTDSLLPAFKSPDHMAVPMLSEHLFMLLGTLWYDQLKVKKLLTLNKHGKAKRMDASLLLEGYAPMSTPSALSKMCFLHNLICVHLYEGMEAVRSIRNSFAHSRVPLDLGHQEFESRITRLSSTWAVGIEPDKAPITYTQHDEAGNIVDQHTMDWGRSVFFISVGNMLGHLRQKHFSGRGSHCEN